MVFYGLTPTRRLSQPCKCTRFQLQDAGTWCCLSRAPSVLISRDCCVLKLLNCFLRMSFLLPAFTGLWLVDLWVILKPVHVFSLFPPVPTPCILITAARRPKHNMSQRTWNQTRGGTIDLVMPSRLIPLSSARAGMGGACACARHTLLCCKCNHGTDILSGIEERNCCQEGSRGDLVCGVIKHVLLQRLMF